MKSKLRFNFDKYKYQEDYPDLVLNHVLNRGSNRDKWGFVTHSTDPISLMFYQKVDHPFEMMDFDPD